MKIDANESLRRKRERGKKWAANHRVRRNDMPSEMANEERDRDVERYRNSENRRRQNLEAVRRANYRKLGITVADYDKMVMMQGGRCACCGCANPGSSRKYWCVDHDHFTGKVRGLLCHKCNAAIAFLGDTIEGVVLALAYLRRHGDSCG